MKQEEYRANLLEPALIYHRLERIHCRMFETCRSNVDYNRRRRYIIVPQDVEDTTRMPLINMECTKDPATPNPNP